jgi:hypothetical protein
MPSYKIKVFSDNCLILTRYENAEHVRGQYPQTSQSLVIMKEELEQLIGTLKDYAANS